MLLSRPRRPAGQVGLAAGCCRSQLGCRGLPHPLCARTGDLPSLWDTDTARAQELLPQLDDRPTPSGRAPSTLSLGYDKAVDWTCPCCPRLRTFNPTPAGPP